jgi:hypothetical protein
MAAGSPKVKPSLDAAIVSLNDFPTACSALTGLLQKMPLFDGIDRKAIEEIVTCANLRHYHSGEFILDGLVGLLSMSRV